MIPVNLGGQDPNEADIDGEPGDLLVVSVSGAVQLYFMTSLNAQTTWTQLA
jgi:hypothetical protein